MTINWVSIEEIEEISKSIRERAEEEAKTTMEAVEAAIKQADEAAESARTASEKASARAEKIGKLARVMAEEAARTANEAAESARTALEEASIRAEEVSRQARAMAEEAAREAKEATEAAIKQANEAAESARMVLQQASSRADEITEFARQMAEETARVAREAAETAKAAFQKALARGISTSEEARNTGETEAKKKTGVEEIQHLEVGVAEPQAREQASTETEVDGFLNALLERAIEELPSEPLMAELGDSPNNPLQKGGESDEGKQNDPEDIWNRELGVAEPQPEEQIRGETGEPGQDIWSKLHQGGVLIRVAPNVGIHQLHDFQERLSQLENLRVIWSGGSSDGGPTIAVSLQKPMTLMRALNEFPIVDSVSAEDKDIIVVLKD